MEADEIRMVAKESSNVELIKRGVQNYFAQKGTYAKVHAAKGGGFSPIGTAASLIAFGARCLDFDEEDIVTLLTKLNEDGVM